MSKILVIGARGRAGKAAAEEAAGRGHEVVGVARTAGDGLVLGDVTDAGRIAELAAGQDAVIAAVYDSRSDPSEFYPAAARALVEGLEKAGVPRLVWVGLASSLRTTDGTLLMDTDGFPNEYRPFYLAHHAALDVFTASSLDWVALAPSGDFDHADPSRRGRYRVAAADAQALISYADFAVALVDEIDHPAHRRTAIGVAV